MMKTKLFLLRTRDQLKKWRFRLFAETEPLGVTNALTLLFVPLTQTMCKQFHRPFSFFWYFFVFFFEGFFALVPIFQSDLKSVAFICDSHISMNRSSLMVWRRAYILLLFFSFVCWTKERERERDSVWKLIVFCVAITSFIIAIVIVIFVSQQFHFSRLFIGQKWKTKPTDRHNNLESASPYNTKKIYKRMARCRWHTANKKLQEWIKSVFAIHFH